MSTALLPDYYVQIQPQFLINGGRHMNKAVEEKLEAVKVDNTVLLEDVTAIVGEKRKIEEEANITSETNDNNNELKVENTEKTDDDRNTKKPNNTANKKLTLKNRHQATHPEKNDRLCSFVVRGEVCPYSDTCQYSHNVKDYLSRKPADISSDCYQFKNFGYCMNGIMCRFGSSHVDIENSRSISRPIEEGGVIERSNINTLSKETQLLLRKKNYKEIISKPKVTYSYPNLDAYPERSKKMIDFAGKVYIAPLTTVGNLPFRRVMKDFGADITCGEMAMGTNILSGQASEWALLRRHASEDLFGIQIAGNYPDMMTNLAKILNHETDSDFVDLNCGCPIDCLCSRGAGAALLNKPGKLISLVKALADNLTTPRAVTVKVRTGWDEKTPTTHKLIPMLQQAAKGRIAAVMIHGRSRLQRYHKLANWDYINECASAQDPKLPYLPIIGNGDICSYDDWKNHQQLMRMQQQLVIEKDFVSSAVDMANAVDISSDNQLKSGVEKSSVDGVEANNNAGYLCDCAMLGRGALIKPWLPTEIKEKRTWDISASERLDMIQRFCNYGLEHWGSDQQGVNNTRRFLLEWLSFLHRYVPSGMLEYGQPQRMNQRPPAYSGRCDLESLLSSSYSQDWIKISEMFLGPVDTGFNFIPKHKTNSYVPESDPRSSANKDATTSTSCSNAAAMAEEEDGING